MAPGKRDPWNKRTGIFADKRVVAGVYPVTVAQPNSSISPEWFQGQNQRWQKKEIGRKSDKDCGGHQDAELNKACHY